MNTIIVRGLDEYQESTSSTAVYPGAGEVESTIGLAYATLGLAGEAGEIANKVKKILRGDDMDDYAAYDRKIADELGDVLWYVARVASQLGYSLSDIATANRHKLERRKEAGTIKGSGDSR